MTGADTAADWRSNPDLVAATDGYEQWVKQQVDRLVTNTTAFVAAVKAGNLEAARTRYAEARLGYERVEPVAEAFGDLDRDIDGRVDDFDTPARVRGLPPPGEGGLRRQRRHGPGAGRRRGSSST